MNLNDLRAAVSKYRNFTIQGWMRYLSLKIRGKTVRIVGACLLCGRCCQRISLEANGRWIRREAEFRRVVRQYPEYRRFMIVDRDPRGFLLFSCSWYQPQGVCRDHGSRLPICRDFPHPSLYFSDGSVPRGCGYSFKVVTPFKKVLQNELDANTEDTDN